MSTVLSEPRAIFGGSPQGSILGNLLLTLTTDELTAGVDYEHLNEVAHEEVSNVRASAETFDLSPELNETKIIRLDLSLARITDGASEYGMDNITVEQIEEDNQTYPFESNSYTTDELLPKDYHQSTSSTRGQFADFRPPGNLVSSCLSGDYSSTAGETFV